MRVLTSWAIRLVCVVGAIGTSAQAAHARPLFTCDLDSLVFSSTVIVEGEISSTKIVNYIDVLTVKVTKTYTGDFKEAAEVKVGLGEYRKVGENGQSESFAAGDKVILFLAAARKEWQEQGIPYWPAGSGVKVVIHGKVMGMKQWGNPGPYKDVVPEGELEKFREKLMTSIKTVDEFKKQFAQHMKDGDWLLTKLKERAAMPEKQVEAVGFVRDVIATSLCEAINATADREKIELAKKVMAGKPGNWIPDHLLQ